ncbi:MAG: MarR family transcriptional regulator [Candidatus Marinimicrobia bacterium]|nr:MarR family transcriptional regulator [Candidatus Neomarinimicrobiota bacterium]MCF7828457.1 MarR family transcriptional regulator [Candidatus Neomarinimicrobiota bacterium]MCF7880949.1 MarR family transcriptional regulator [Candidatus Neomarinimicrobiota bacterium]
MPTHYKGTKEEKRALNTYIKLIRAADTITGRLNELKTLDDLSMSQFGTLESLYHLGPMYQKDICQKILKSSGNITMVLDNLEKKGLVTRERDKTDRRYIRIVLTDKGREKIEKILPPHVRAIVEMMNNLTPKEQMELGRLTKKLGKTVQES